MSTVDAMYEVARENPDGSGQSIFTCSNHLLGTMKLMEQAGSTVTVKRANRDKNDVPLAIPVHGCKGHDAGWPLD